MKRCGMLVAVLTLAIAFASPAIGEGREPATGAETVDNSVRVTITKQGGQYRTEVDAGGGGQGSGRTCEIIWIRVFRQDPVHGDSLIYSYRCSDGASGTRVVPPSEVVDLDRAATLEAGRYVEDVLVPVIRIGVNPGVRGLVGFPSWFWVEGWSGAASAAPISAYGVTIDVRLSSGTVTWAFGDGATMAGDLGRPYPAESSVQHPYPRPGTYTVTAGIAMTPEYRVDGGPWITLPPLTATATATHEVEERQAVITRR